MLDLVHLFTFVGAVQGVFFSLLLIRLAKGHLLANRLLAAFLLTFSLSMFGISAYSSGLILKAPHFGLVHAPFAVLTPILLYLYFLALTRKDFRLQPRHWLLFLPIGVEIVWLMPFYALPAAEKYHILLGSYEQIPARWKISFVFSVLVNFVFLLLTYLTIVRHERVIREVYSSPLNKTLLWARHFLYAGIATFALCVAVSFFSIAWADPLSNLLFSVIIYVFGYRAIRQPDIFSDVGEETIPSENAPALVHPSARYEKSGLSEARARLFLDKLERLMQEEKIYLDPTLNLQQLSARLDAPPHQVSQLLNQFKGESFSDFVNRYRVGHFKKAVGEPANAHLSLLAVAFDSGFNSKAAFNAVFKKMTGLTPSEFKESMEQEVFPGK